MNILPGIKAVLIDGGLTTPIKKTKMPDSPKKVVVLYDTGEIEPDVNATHSTEIEQRTVQVLIRAATYLEAKADADMIKTALNRRIAVEAGGIHFLSIHTLGGGGHLGKSDSDGLHRFSLNFRCRARVI